MGPRERLALALCSGLRRSDLMRMGRQHVKDSMIRVCQVKRPAPNSGYRSTTELVAILVETPADNMTFLMTAQGKPFPAPPRGPLACKPVAPTACARPQRADSPRPDARTNRSPR